LLTQKFAGNITVFADDASFSYCAHTLTEGHIKMNYDLEIIRKWLYLHKLKISTKTKPMIFSLIGETPSIVPVKYHDPKCKKFLLIKNQSDTLFQECYTCDENCFDIEMVTSFKLLGLDIDNMLTWDRQTTSLLNYSRKVIRILFELSSYCSTSLLKIVYYALFNSKIQYGIVCWGGTYQNRLEHILLAQKHAMRIICHKNRLTPSFPLFVELGILPLRHLYFYRTLRIYFLRSGYFEQRTCSSYNLRANNLSLASIPRAKTTNFAQFFSVLAPTIYNKLPLHIRSNIRNLGILRCLNEIKNWFLNFDHTQIETLSNIVS